MALPHVSNEAPSNPLLARYRKILARQRFYDEELAQDREISRAQGQTWEQITRLRQRAEALRNLSATVLRITFNVGFGDFDDEQWRKVYANQNLVETTETFLSQLENYCDLYETARDATREQPAP
ncbi:Uncharacterised protein [Mycobacteroides abscessus subsp. abscessus]|uniref:hypothetical protein n=1 Tax=Mycobacteroides abscessus TaxID=36809 RepID=UPI00092A39DB|nr:hypothetical protein [Mycobacteroides abscessus]SHU69627.1 Uncharacterised protein [Mycobacteroides abscessus subsp. abscessus]